MPHQITFCNRSNEPVFVYVCTDPKMKIWIAVQLVLVLTLQRIAAQSSQTCQGLENLASNAESSLVCGRDDLCTELMCNITGELAPFFHSTRVVLLPCATPPGIMLQLTNSSSIMIVDEAIISVQVIPVKIYFAQVNQFAPLGNIHVMVNSTEELVGIKIVLSDGMIPDPVTIFSFTEVALDRSSCVMGTSESTPSDTTRSMDTDTSTVNDTEATLLQTTLSGDLIPTFTLTVLFISLFCSYCLL